MKRASVADYDRICVSIKRWRRRLTRAINALNKLEGQKARIERKLGLLEASS